MNVRRACAAALLLAIVCPALHAQDDQGARRSVVKVFCTSNRLDLSSPWKRGSGGEATGTGIWLGARRILTNEHLVDFATQVSVQPYESAERIPAGRNVVVRDLADPVTLLVEPVGSTEDKGT